MFWKVLAFLCQWIVTAFLIGAVLRVAFPFFGISDNVGNHPVVGGAVTLGALALTGYSWVWIYKRLRVN